jgi:hypothetical protein
LAPENGQTAGHGGTPHQLQGPFRCGDGVARVWKNVLSSVDLGSLSSEALPQQKGAARTYRKVYSSGSISQRNDCRPAVFDVEAGLESADTISPRPWSVIVIVARPQRSGWSRYQMSALTIRQRPPSLQFVGGGSGTVRNLVCGAGSVITRRRTCRRT